MVNVRRPSRSTWKSSEGDERVRTAHHEAGHVVLGALLDDVPERASIASNATTLGRTQQRSRAAPPALAQIYLGGFAAEHILTGRRPRQLDAEIGVAVEQVLRTGVRTVEEDIRGEVDRLYEVARRSLSGSWPAVAAVAAALLDAGELDRAGIAALLSAAR